jgi:hypothetical protein
VSSGISPSLPHLLLHDSLECGRVSIEALGDWWADVLGRGATPFDVAGDLAGWGERMAARAEPDWSSPNEIVLSTPLARLRDFTPARPPRVTPTLVLPPQAVLAATLDRTPLEVLEMTERIHQTITP